MFLNLNLNALHSQGPWIVHKSAGKTASLLGQMLKIKYFRGENYLEVTLPNIHIS